MPLMFALVISVELFVETLVFLRFDILFLLEINPPGMYAPLLFFLRTFLFESILMGPCYALLI